jgi:hypothetical protein
MRFAHVIFIFFVELFSIEPRPLEAIEPRPLETEILPRPIESITASEILPPDPPEPPADPAAAIAQIAITTHAVTPVSKYDGPTQSEILLQAIILVARREPPNQGALRNLIMKFSSEYSLDF